MSRRPTRPFVALALLAAARLSAAAPAPEPIAGSLHPSAPETPALPSAREAHREALFFRALVAADPTGGPAARADEAPVLRAFRQASAQAQQMGRKAGYNHLTKAMSDALMAARKEVPAPFFYGLRAVVDLGWHLTHNQPPFKRWGTGRDHLVAAARFVAENADRFLGDEAASFQAVLALTRISLTDRDWYARRWMYAALVKEFFSKPGIVSNPNYLALLQAARDADHGHAKGGVAAAITEALRAAETRELDTQAYFQLALQAGAQVRVHFDAYWTMRCFLHSAQTVPGDWGAIAIRGLVRAADTFDETGWIRYPIGSEEPFRRQAQKITEFLAEGAPGLEALADVLSRKTPDGKYWAFQNWTVWKIFQAIDLEAVPPRYLDEVEELQLDGDISQIRAFLGRLAGEGAS